MASVASPPSLPDVASSATPGISSSFSLRDKLLFAQAVHKVGAGPLNASSTLPAASSAAQTGKKPETWAKVSRLLEGHPCIKRPAGWWTAVEEDGRDRCLHVYEELMQEAGERVDENVERNQKPTAPAHLRLAQFFYKSRMEELRNEIVKQEDKFRTLVSEIDAIKSGSAIYNPALVSEIREIIVRNRKQDVTSSANLIAQSNGQIAIVANTAIIELPKDWVPTQEQLRDAAKGKIRNMGPKKVQEIQVEDTKEQDVAVQKQPEDLKQQERVESSQEVEAVEAVEIQGAAEETAGKGLETIAKEIVEDKDEEAEVETLAVGPDSSSKQTPPPPSTPVVTGEQAAKAESTPKTSVAEAQGTPSKSTEKDDTAEDEESVKQVKDMEMDLEPEASTETNEAKQEIAASPTKSVASAPVPVPVPVPVPAPEPEPSQDENQDENLDDDASSTRSELTPPPEEHEESSPVRPSRSSIRSRSGRPPSEDRTGRARRGAQDEPLSSAPSTPFHPKQELIDEGDENDADADADNDEIDHKKRTSGTEEDHAATEEEDDAPATRRGTKRRFSTRNARADAEEEEPTVSSTRRSSKQSPERPMRSRGTKDSPNEKAASREPESSRTTRGGRKSMRGKEKGESPVGDDAEEEEDKLERPEIRTRASRRVAKEDSDQEEESRPRKHTKVDHKAGAGGRSTRNKPAPEETKRETQPRGRASGIGSLTDEDDEDAEETKRHLPPPSSSPQPEGPRKTRSSVPQAQKTSKVVLKQLYDDIIKHKNGSVFALPVRPSDAPGYYDIVKRPMDLKKIRTNINNGTITSVDELQRDLWLMFCNAMMYNKPGSQTHRMAQEMMSWCEDKLLAHRNIEAHSRRAL